MIVLNNFLFIAFPYIAITVFVIGTIYRYRNAGYKTTALSSQFLESKRIFWGIVPFHFGILVVLLGHLLMFLFPGAVLAWNSDPLRLIVHEGIMFAFAVSLLLGLVILIYRRWSDPRVRVVTTKMDMAIELLLLAQIVLGCWTALAYRWGSSWFAADLTPYLWSIFTLDPQIQAVTTLPVVIKLHITGAFAILLLIPFSRLIHMLVAPLHYLWRPYQQVIWNWNRKSIREPDTAWEHHPPRNR